MISERWIGNDMEGCACDLPGGIEDKSPRAEIWTWDLRNIKQEW
jgi:hypothetical protein